MPLDLNTHRTVLHALEATAARLQDRPALWSKSGATYLPTSWRDYAQKVRLAARGLSKLGMGKGDVLGLMSANREEARVLTLAGMALGGVALGLAAGSSAEQVQSVLAHAEVKLLVVEGREALARVTSLRASLPALERVVVVEGGASKLKGAIPYEELLKRGQSVPAASYDRALEALEPAQLAALVYGLDADGKPLGRMLTHENLRWTASRLGETVKLGEDDVMLSVQPLADLSGQLLSLYLPLVLGYQVYCASSTAPLAQSLREVRPTLLFGAPPLWEALTLLLEADFARRTGLEGSLAAQGRRIARERNLLTLGKLRVPALTELGYLAAQRGPLAGFKKRLGLDRAWVLMSSGAPVALDVLQNLTSFDVIVRELYARSEATGPITANAVKATRFGTVGRPLLGVEVCINDAGEVLVRGPSATPGYYRNDARTQALFTGGWMRSGDRGALDGEGFLTLERESPGGKGLSASP